jgi:hypothetical protein
VGLIHDPNTRQWKPGDLVIHDSDAKRTDMLMIVLGQDASGVFRTRYAYPWVQARPWRRKIWRNTVEWLALLMDKFTNGSEPEMGEWLDSLALMATYSRYFSSEEIQLIMGNLQAVRAEWEPLLAQVRQMMHSGVPATDPRVQPLAQHWMGMVHQWLGGDFDLIERWGRMYQEEPLTRSTQTPEPALLRYIDQATALRMAAWQRHFDTAEMSRFRRVDPAQWQQLSLAVLDAVAWPLAAVLLIYLSCMPLGVVGVVLMAAAFVLSVARLRRAIWLNHRYRFTTWRWGGMVFGLMMVGAVLNMSG